jgi:RNA polymerase sigma factor (sigma-70 family)
MTPDSELLRQFAKTHAEDAFAELVKRHVNLVYSAALRQVNGDAHSAQDVAQTVFTDLARKADSLAQRESVTGWLYTSAHFAAAKIVRTENRRRDREEKFMREPTHETAPEADWETLRPLLDDTMHELKEADREAILLRYFENRSFTEVGAKLGLNENAARMRVDRAVEKLRDILTRRGLTTATALASVISANAVQLAPASLAATLTAASLVSAGTGTFTLLKIMTMTKLKLGISALVVAGAATVLLVQHHAQEKLRSENEALTQQLAQLKTDNEKPSNQPATTGESKKLPDEQFNELLRLRGEVSVLRRQKSELENSLTKAQNVQSRVQKTITAQPPTPLPDDYPKTADGAAKGIFELMARGDWNAFTNFDIDGGRENFEKAMGDKMKDYLRGMEIVSIGEPTNSFGPNMWFVPYTIRFRDGNEKSFRLHVAQDPRTQRWILKGGL